MEGEVSDIKKEIGELQGRIDEQSASIASVRESLDARLMRIDERLGGEKGVNVQLGKIETKLNLLAWIGAAFGSSLILVVITFLILGR